MKPKSSASPQVEAPPHCAVDVAEAFGIVVGGVGGVQGPPIATFDLDVVHSRHPANVERLLAALDILSA